MRIYIAIIQFEFGFCNPNNFVICIDKPDDEGDKEFINDLMMIIASFSGRLYGSRSAKRRKELKEQKLKENEKSKG